MLKTQLLQHSEFENLRLSFLDAFSDYKIKINVDEAVFKARLQRISCDLELSVGVFDKDKIIAFVISGIGEHNKKRTAYNGGTGVNPKFRGQQLSRKMYQFLFEEFRKIDIQQCLLEVIQDNHYAVKVYSDLGFRKTKEYKCFSLNKVITINKKYSFPIVIKKTLLPKWEIYTKFWSVSPSWQNSISAINNTLKEETLILEAYSENTLIGYLISDSITGTISQLAIQQDYRQKGVASSLLNEAQKLARTQKMSIINIDSEATETLSFFESLGFQNHLNQFEMLLDLE